MPAMSQFAKLIVVLILAALDVANYIWGVEVYGVRNEQVIGVIVTLLLAVVSMVGVTVPSQPRKTTLP